MCSQIPSGSTAASIPTRMLMATPSATLIRWGCGPSSSGAMQVRSRWATSMGSGALRQPPTATTPWAFLARGDGETLNGLLKRLDRVIGRYYNDGEVVDEINGC